MKLRHSYDSKDGIPAELLDYYVEKNGKWLLQSEDSDNALSTLEKERENRARIEKELNEMRKRSDSLKDVDPEKYRSLLELEEKLEREKAESKGNFEKLLEIEKGKWTKEKEKLETERKGAEAYIENLLVGKAISDKLGGKVKPAFAKALEAHLRATMKPAVIAEGDTRKAVGHLDGAQIELASALDGWLAGDEAKEFLLAEHNSGGGEVPGKPAVSVPTAGKLNPQQAAALSPSDYAKARREGRIG